MIPFRILQNFLVISFSVICLSCSGTKKEYANADNHDVAQMEDNQNLPPLTCDSIDIDKKTGVVSFRLNNNTNSLISLISSPEFEYEDGSEWKKIHLKKHITGILGDSPLVPSGGDYICKLFLNDYEIDSVSDVFRIVQPYHIRTYPTPPPNTPIDTKYLIHEFRIPD